MSLDDELTASDFRLQARQWLASVERPPGLRDYGPTPTSDDVPAGRQWQRMLVEAGYACLHWPTRYGGRGATVEEQATFAEETARAGVPRQLSMVGPDLVGPVLMKFGSEEQLQLLAPIRTGEHLWCQLFSEPDAGSDLASLATRAEFADGHWTINGQKVWTSAAAAAEYGLLIARIGPRKHADLSAFIVPMRSDGIDIRPIRQMDGESKFNEVFFSNLTLRKEHLIGQPGDGWTIATTTLGQERLTLGANAVSMFDSITRLITTAQTHDRLNPVLQDQITQLWIRVWLLKATWIRALQERQGLSSPTFSVLKLMASETKQAIGDLGAQALGMPCLVAPEEEPLVQEMLVGRAQTILGGTSEIQRNILAERVLGLPSSSKAAK